MIRRPRPTTALIVLTLAGLATLPASWAVAALPQQHGEQEAAGGEEHGEEVPHGMPWSEVAFRWANFLLLGGLLYWMLVIPPPAIQEIFSFPGLKVILGRRAEQVLEARELAKQRAAEAENIVSGSKDRLARIEEEVAGLVAQAGEDGQRERARAEEEGRAQAEKLRETARRELRAETLGAQRQLRGFVAELAVGVAEKTIRENLTAADQERLVEDYLSRLGGRIG